MRINAGDVRPPTWLYPRPVSVFLVSLIVDASRLQTAAERAHRAGSER